MVRSVLRFATVTCVLAPMLSLRAQDQAITWCAEARSVEALAGKAAAACPTVKAWLPFAAESNSRLVLSNDARVLLVLCDSYARRGAKKEHHDVEVMVDLLQRTVAATDRLVSAQPDTEPLVVIGVRTAMYPKLLAHLTKLDPRLSDWATGAGRAANGFILSNPLIAAWVDDPVGVDEWHPHNELVHRTAQLLIRREAPQLPTWFLLGLGWHVEDAVQSSVYCFPHRSGFVAAADHTDWGLWLASNFKANRRKGVGKGDLLGIDEFASWSPGADDEFTTGRAYIAFGLARYLAYEHPAAIRELATKFNAAIEKGSKVWKSEHEWTTVPNFQIPAAEQLAMLTAVERDLLAKATDYFLKKKANERRAPEKKRVATASPGK